MFDEFLVRVKIINARKLRQTVLDVVKIPLDINVARLRVKEMHNAVAVFGDENVKAFAWPRNENFSACTVTPTCHVFDNLSLARTLGTVQPHGTFENFVPILCEAVGIQIESRSCHNVITAHSHFVSHDTLLAVNLERKPVRKARIRRPNVFIRT